MNAMKAHPNLYKNLINSLGKAEGKEPSVKTFRQTIEPALSWNWETILIPNTWTKARVTNAHNYLNGLKTRRPRLYELIGRDPVSKFQRYLDAFSEQTPNNTFRVTGTSLTDSAGNKVNIPSAIPEFKLRVDDKFVSAQPGKPFRGTMTPRQFIAQAGSPQYAQNYLQRIQSDPDWTFKNTGYQVGQDLVKAYDTPVDVNLSDKIRGSYSSPHRITGSTQYNKLHPIQDPVNISVKPVEPMQGFINKEQVGDRTSGGPTPYSLAHPQDAVSVALRHQMSHALFPLHVTTETKEPGLVDRMMGMDNPVLVTQSTPALATVAEGSTPGIIGSNWATFSKDYAQDSVELMQKQMAVKLALQNIKSQIRQGIHKWPAQFQSWVMKQPDTFQLTKSKATGNIIPFSAQKRVYRMYRDLANHPQYRQYLDSDVSRAVQNFSFLATFRDLLSSDFKTKHSLNQLAKDRQGRVQALRKGTERDTRDQFIKDFIAEYYPQYAGNEKFISQIKYTILPQLRRRFFLLDAINMNKLASKQQR